MNDPYWSGCPVCKILPRRDYERNAPIDVSNTFVPTLNDRRVVICNNCGVLFTILKEYENRNDDEIEEL